MLGQDVAVLIANLSKSVLDANALTEKTIE